MLLRQRLIAVLCCFGIAGSVAPAVFGTSFVQYLFVCLAIVFVDPCCYLFGGLLIFPVVGFVWFRPAHCGYRFKRRLVAVSVWVNIFCFSYLNLALALMELLKSVFSKYNLLFMDFVLQNC